MSRRSSSAKILRMIQSIPQGAPSKLEHSRETRCHVVRHEKSSYREKQLLVAIDYLLQCHKVTCMKLLPSTATVGSYGSPLHLGCREIVECARLEK